MSARIAILVGQPVVDGQALYVVAPSVEECRSLYGGEWQPLCADERLCEKSHERRMVPVSLPPSPTMPSTAKRCGRGCSEGHEYDGTCILGTVPSPWLIAIEQWRHPNEGDEGWRACDGSTPCSRARNEHHERRQVVVAESPAPDVLPVTSTATTTRSFDVGARWIWRRQSHDGRVDVYLRHRDGQGGVVDKAVTDEPWAANLRPDQAVWRFTPTLLDTPITKKREWRTDEEGQEVDLHWVPVPLSLVEGQPTIIEVP